MLTGYSAILPSVVLLDSGILVIGSSPIGTSRGEPDFGPNSTFENVEFDGKGPPVKGIDRLFHGEPMFSMTLIEFGDSTTGNQIAKLLPGSSSATAGGAGASVTTITPKVGSVFLAAGDYLVDVRLLFERGIGTGTKKYAAIYFPFALVTDWGKLKGGNKKEATYPISIAARLDPTGALNAAAYKIELREAQP